MTLSIRHSTSNSKKRCNNLITNIWKLILTNMDNRQSDKHKHYKLPGENILSFKYHRYVSPLDIGRDNETTEINSRIGQAQAAVGDLRTFWGQIQTH